MNKSTKLFDGHLRFCSSFVRSSSCMRSLVLKEKSHGDYPPASGVEAIGLWVKESRTLEMEKNLWCFFCWRECHRWKYTWSNTCFIICVYSLMHKIIWMYYSDVDSLILYSFIDSWLIIYTKCVFLWMLQGHGSCFGTWPVLFLFAKNHLFCKRTGET